jgi:hypothetical protein
MEIFNSKKFIILMVLILLLAGLTGCAKHAVYKTNTTLQDLYRRKLQMKDLLKNKKVWIGAAVVVIIFAWVLWSGQPAPEVAQ